VRDFVYAAGIAYPLIASVTVRKKRSFEQFGLEKQVDISYSTLLRRKYAKAGIGTTSNKLYMWENNVAGERAEAHA
jgi:hypothetical protein